MSQLFQTAYATRTDFVVSKEIRIILTSFLQSLKNIMAILCQKKLFFLSVVIVLQLKYRPNSAQTDCDNRGRQKLARVGQGMGETKLPTSPERQGKLEMDQLMERETGRDGGIRWQLDKERRDKGELGLWASSRESRLQKMKT